MRKWPRKSDPQVTSKIKIEIEFLSLLMSLKDVNIERNIEKFLNSIDICLNTFYF